MEFIKKHWVKIVIGLLIIFSLNKCTVACNRDTKINKQSIEIMQKDSIIRAQEDSLNIMRIRWNDAQTSQTAYQGIAMGNQQDLVNQIEKLTNENNDLNVKINKLTSENNKLKYDINQLRTQLKNINK